jgi:hypothetical protein
MPISLTFLTFQNDKLKAAVAWLAPLLRILNASGSILGLED